MEKTVSFEVNCRNAVTKREVKLKNTVTGEQFSVPTKSWHWRNSWYADVTFEFKGREFTVCAEVDPVLPCWL